MQTQIYNNIHLNMPCVCIENEYLLVKVLPNLGAKVASMVYKPHNYEVFYQPTDGAYRQANYNDDFAAYDTSGFDDMFPTIDVCSSEGITWPDHGELWPLEWDVAQTQNNLHCKVQGVQWPYTFERIMSLDKATLNLSYSITNTTDKPLWGFWAFHGLINYDDQTTIQLPNCDKVVNVHSSNNLGAVGTEHNFPKTTSGFNLNTPLSKGLVNTEKYYVNQPLSIGECSAIVNQNKLLYILRYDPKELPYLGVWLNQGGFKNEYNLALEPTNGFYDTIPIAALNGLKPIAPNSSLKFNLAINLIEL